MNKFNTLAFAALSVIAVTSAHARYTDLAGTSYNSLTSTRAAALAGFERAQPPQKPKTDAAMTRAPERVDAPVVKAMPQSAATMAAPNLARTQGRMAYLRALSNGDVAAASSDFGTSPQANRATR